MALYGEARDISMFRYINRELMHNIISQQCVLYKVNVTETKTNMYGETAAETGKWYMPAIQISSLVERADMTAEYDDFGPSRNQDYVFKMREKMLKQVNFYPEIGDIVLFNDRYYEIDNVVQEQLLGGQPDKSHSIICNGHYTKITSLNVLERND
jgi:hypothetical protein